MERESPQVRYGAGSFEHSHNCLTPFPYVLLSHDLRSALCFISLIFGGVGLTYVTEVTLERRISKIVVSFCRSSRYGRRGGVGTEMEIMVRAGAVETV